MRLNKMKAVVFLITAVLFVTIKAAKDYCPKKNDIVCIVGSNDCCCDADCGRGEICCSENCGNTCHKPARRQTNGKRVYYNKKCSLGVIGGGEEAKDYCPKKNDIVCIVGSNDCCCDADCGRGEICCSENCGNTCHKPARRQTNGKRVYYNKKCSLGVIGGGEEAKDYCPKKSDIFCYVGRNECCCDADCGRGKICCSENCGNTCHKPARRQTNGKRVYYNKKCSLGVIGGGEEGLYCPIKENIYCVRSINHCCKDSDCCKGYICCQENCGTVCRLPVYRKTNGTRVISDHSCRIDPY